MRWTPGGRQIVFTGSIGHTASLYGMAPDGTGLRRLVRERTTADAAVFSPDGRLMAYNDRRHDGPPRRGRSRAPAAHGAVGQGLGSAPPLTP
jgi:Tol biopolymer transport system component